MPRPALLATTAALAAALGSVTAGPIDPPTGPVAPTMKTLDQVEPRTAINEVNTPGDANAAFIITQPGSYYLTENLSVNGQPGDSGDVTVNAIEIRANYVTIDLNGFHIEGGELSGHAITVPPDTYYTHFRVRNGTIRGFGDSAIKITSFVNPRDAQQTISGAAIIEDLTISDSGSWGIDARNASVFRCRVENNLGGGAQVRHVEDSVAFNNVINAGVIVGFGFKAKRIHNCIAQRHDIGHDVEANGIITGSVATDNVRAGIRLGSGAIAERCSSSTNGAGFAVANNAVVRDSIASFNSGSGFNAFSFSARLEHNHSNDNAIGYEIEERKNYLVGNTADDNTVNWDVVPGNICYVIKLGSTAEINGDAGGASLTSSTTANFTF